MTMAEAERYYDFYVENEAIKVDTFLRMFALYNMESTGMAVRGTEKTINEYVRALRKKIKDDDVENDLEQQFRETKFE